MKGIFINLLHNRFLNILPNRNNKITTATKSIKRVCGEIIIDR